jgi:Protein of unknown function (DUF998)
VSVGLLPEDIQEQLPTGALPSATSRRFAGLSVFRVLLGAALLALLHIFSKHLSPLSQPISNYAFTRYGWLFDLAIIVFALGLATLLCALVAGELVELGSGSFVVTATCCVCLVVLVLCPDEGSGGGLSATGWAHWASAMAFGGLLVTPVVLGGRHRSHTGCSRLPGIARWLAYWAGAWFVMLLMGSLVKQSTPLAVWRIGGLVERALSVSEVVVAMLLAVWARRGCSCIRRNSADRIGFSCIG